VTALTAPTAGHDLAPEAPLPSEVAHSSQVPVDKKLLHDLGNEASAVLGALEMALMQAREEPTRRYVGLSRDGAQRLVALIAAIRSAARMPVNHGSTSATVHLQSVIEALVDLYRPIAAEHGLRIQFSASAGLRPATIDVQALHRLVGNVLLNAIRHSRGTRIGVRVEPSAHTDSGAIEIRIIDNGVGVGVRQCDDLNRLLQGPPTALDAQHRSGMAIIGDLAAQLGAHVELVSWPKVGTKVTLRVRSHGTD
jgi:signal transduction histidine kinase